MDHRESRETSWTGTCRIGLSGREERSVLSVGFAIRSSGSSVRQDANGSSGRMLSGRRYRDRPVVSLSDRRYVQASRIVRMIELVSDRMALSGEKSVPRERE
ncbi:hypothetical protein Bca4012_026615 [Brassica carinata]